MYGRGGLTALSVRARLRGAPKHTARDTGQVSRSEGRWKALTDGTGRDHALEADLKGRSLQ